MSSTPTSRLRVTVSTLQGKTSILVFPLPLSPLSVLPSLLTSISAKLNIKVKRLFHSTSGVELLEENIREILIDGVKLMASKGEQYTLSSGKNSNKNKNENEEKNANPKDKNDYTETDKDKEPNDNKTQNPSHDLTSLSPSPSPSLPSNTPTLPPPIIKILSRLSPVEQSAISQLHNVSKMFPNIRLSVGLPDLHEGRSHPIGCAVCSESIVFPELVAGDIGCGMSLLSTHLKSHKVSDKKLQRWVKRLNGLELPWEGNVSHWVKNDLEWPENTHVENIAEESRKHLESYGIKLEDHYPTVGTIGGGNHFAELQQVETISDEEEFHRLGMNKNHLCLLVHSGSRSLGDEILTKFLNNYDKMSPSAVTSVGKGVRENTKEFDDYMECHRIACAFAKRNRALIAKRFIQCLGNGEMELEKENEQMDLEDEEEEEEKQEGEEQKGEGEAEEEQHRGKIPINTAVVDEPKYDSTHSSYSCILDIWHNSVTKTHFPSLNSFLYLHRKGAAPADRGPVVIPGSRGAMSYVVIPIERKIENNDNSSIASTSSSSSPSLSPMSIQESSAFSLAHGAGRQWSRSKARQHLSSRHPNPQKLKFTDLNSHVICEEKDLLYEEAPQAYKNIENIIKDLTEEKLIKVVCTLRPLITYKTRSKEKEDTENQKEREKERGKERDRERERERERAEEED